MQRASMSASLINSLLAVRRAAFHELARPLMMSSRVAIRRQVCSTRELGVATCEHQ